MAVRSNRLPLTSRLTALRVRRQLPRQDDRVEYGRYGNPTVAAVERKLADLDSGETALLFSSGMAAITVTLLSVLSAGDHLVMTDDCYRRTRQFATEFLPAMASYLPWYQ